MTHGNAEWEEELLAARSQLGLKAFLNRYAYVLLGLAGIALFLAIWSAVSLFALAPEYLVPAPQLVATSLYGLFASGAILPHLWFSAQEFLVGYSLAARKRSGIPRTALPRLVERCPKDPRNQRRPSAKRS